MDDWQFNGCDSIRQLGTWKFSCVSCMYEKARYPCRYFQIFLPSHTIFSMLKGYLCNLHTKFRRRQNRLFILLLASGKVHWNWHWRFLLLLPSIKKILLFLFVNGLILFFFSHYILEISYIKINYFEIIYIVISYFIIYLKNNFFIKNTYMMT